jgi:hypothetical protein
MGKIIERCAGIDVGKRFLFCCVLTGAANEEPHGQTLRLAPDVTVKSGVRCSRASVRPRRRRRSSSEPIS